MTTDFGTDLSATSGLDPAFTLVSGARVVAEACYRRLTTERGSLFYAKAYGTDVREMLAARMDQRRLDAWRSKVEAECRKDERVETVKSSFVFDPKTERVTARIEGKTADGPFTLVLAISTVTVELLTVG